MVKPTVNETQIYTVNGLQDAFDLLSRGFEIYSQNANSSNPASGSKANRADSTSSAPRSPNTTHATPIPVFNKKRSPYQPDLDIFDTPDALLVELSLPGVAKADINIEYDSKSNQILLSGDSKRSHIDEEAIRVIRSERSTGHFERTVALADQVVLADQITAEFKDGILLLTVPKNKEAETKKKIELL